MNSGEDAAVAEALAPHEAESGRVTRGEMDAARAWLVGMLDGPPAAEPPLAGGLVAARPFAFRCGSEPSARLLERAAGSTTREGEARVQVWDDAATGLRVTARFRMLPGFPAVEWQLDLANAGDQDTPLLSEVDSLLLRWHGDGAAFTLHGLLGGRSERDDMMPFELAVPTDGSALDLRSGKASSNNYMPFFNLAGPEGGVVAGIGWSGQWRSQWRAAEGTVSWRAGLDNVHFVLRPGERVRLPRMVALRYEGAPLHGQNAFRRMLRTHYVPQLRGQPRRPLVTVNTCFTHHGTGHFLHEADAENLGALVEPFGRLGAELMIIDAGWYPCGENYHQIHDLWPLDPERYPRGLRPLADRCRAAGLDLGLWYSPEWGYDSMPVVRAHPEWADANGRLRLERPEPREWFLDEVERMADEGITCYRQDWYMTYEDPEPDRQGIVELTHFAGLYAMWDELRRRHPDWVMEGCCGGGRRIDLETLARFHWHQKSDRWFDVESDQCSLHGANLFLPGGLINIPTQGTSDYETWSSFPGQFSLGWHPLDAEFPHEQAAAQVALYKRVRDRLDGDFYPLTPCALDAPWVGFQYHDPDTDRGLVLVFRRPGAEVETCTVRLRGLAPERTYAMTYANGDETTATGARLAAGLEVHIPTAPGACLVEVD